MLIYRYTINSLYIYTLYIIVYTLIRILVYIDESINII